jgi:hypothetical protein
MRQHLYKDRIVGVLYTYKPFIILFDIIHHNTIFPPIFPPKKTTFAYFKKKRLFPKELCSGLG